MAEKVALIGCGPSGISVLAAFDEAIKKGENTPQVICFEKQSQPGGLWNFNWKTGVDEYGEPVHGSMHRYLWSNAPKEVAETAKYTFDDHYKQPLSSFPPREITHDYLLGRYKTIENKNAIYFNTAVRDVTEKNKKFIVTYENLETKTRDTDIFDYVIVAIGHYSNPHFPKYNGLEKFIGRTIHCHDFRNAKEFKDQTVLLVGSSYTAEDIAMQLHKFGVKKCIVSHHKQPSKLKWPNNIIEVPGISHFEETTCHLIDGTEISIDSIIFCTGYNHQYNFMDDNLKLREARNLLYFDHLYKGIFLENNPKIMYLAPQDSAFTFIMFDIQAWYARDFILGKIQLPVEQEMKADIKLWLNRFMSNTGSPNAAFINFQRDYLIDLLKNIDYCSDELILKKAEQFIEWDADRSIDIVTYRDKCYTSFKTGTTAVPLTKPWIEIKEMTMEEYLQDTKQNAK